MKEQPDLELACLNSGRQTDRDELEIRRTSARLRHFRGVAAGVMGEAQRLWREIWETLQDERSPDEILEDVCGLRKVLPNGVDRSCLLEKLHLLGIQIDYARRLCEGSIGNDSHEKGAR